MTTRWSAVLQAAQEPSTESDLALEQLCRNYWYPLYAYVRRQGRSEHDAQDLTQEFFARLMQKKTLNFADPQRGRFRTFLLCALKNFLASDWKKGQAEKRGGGRSILSLDDQDLEACFAREHVTADPPDALYDRGWALTVIQNSLKLLREEHGRGAKAEQFEQLKSFIWGTSNRTHAEAGAELGMSEGAVKVATHRLRQRFGELLRTEVMHTVSRPEEVDDELRHLLASIREDHVVS